MRIVIVAGGVGLAPLRPAILRVLARRERYGRVAVLYGARAPDQLLFPEELERWPAEVLADLKAAARADQLVFVADLEFAVEIEPAQERSA